MLKVFGCLCFVSKHTPQHKFDARSRKRAFLGYENGTKGYVVLDTSNKEIFISRNVLFHEMQFPFLKDSPHNITISPQIDTLPAPFIAQDTFPNLTTPTQLDRSTISNEPNPLPPSPNILSPLLMHPETPRSYYSSPSFLPTPSPNSPPPENPLPLRRSNRPSQPPSYLSDYKCDLPSLKSVQSTSTCSYPIQSSITYDRISHSHHRYIMSLSSESEPTSFQEVVQHQCWREAMSREIEALMMNRT